MSEIIYVKDQWWNEVPRLVEKTRELYQKLEAQGRSSLIAGTTKLVLEKRQWGPNQTALRSNLESAIEELGCFYVPKAFGPGPAFIFPMEDLEGKTVRAQMKPCHERFGPQKYHQLGDKTQHLGPTWIGCTEAIAAQILTTASVLLVEGPFDLLAVRTVCPELPSVSSTNKKLGRRHFEFLQLLGVKRIFTMFDIDKSQAGELSADYVARKAGSWAEVTNLSCPAHDPSDCLKQVSKYLSLKSMLYDCLDQIMPSGSLSGPDDEIFLEED